MLFWCLICDSELKQARFTHLLYPPLPFFLCVRKSHGNLEWSNFATMFTHQTPENRKLFKTIFGENGGTRFFRRKCTQRSLFVVIANRALEMENSLGNILVNLIKFSTQITNCLRITRSIANKRISLLNQFSRYVCLIYKIVCIWNENEFWSTSCNAKPEWGNLRCLYNYSIRWLDLS